MAARKPTVSLLSRAMRADRVPSSRAAAFLSALTAVVVLAFADGGYFRETWSWAVVAFSCLAGITLLLRDTIDLGKLEVGTLGALVALAGWTALSAAWSSTPAESAHDAERALVYVAAVLALLLLVERSCLRALLAGVAAGAAVVGCYSLGDRLFTGAGALDPVEGLLLIDPLGYANALGILVSLGALLALGFAAHERTHVGRGAGAAACVPLLAALTLTESRGAWVALGAGLAVSVVVDTRRDRLLTAAVVLALPAATVVWLTGRSKAMTSDESDWWLAVMIAVLAAGAAVASLGAPWLAAQLARRRLPAVLIGSLAILFGSLAVVGTVRAQPLGLRRDYWRVAWNEFEQNPVLGSGAGTFVEYWQRSGVATGVRDAHSLYIETLAELGPLGLLLVLVVLGLPLLAVVRARAHPFAGVAASAYSAFLVHAGLDWDWEMPAVTVTGLSCAVALLVSARPRDGSIGIGARARGCLLLLALALPALSLTSQALVE